MTRAGILVHSFEDVPETAGLAARELVLIKR